MVVIGFTCICRCLVLSSNNLWYVLVNRPTYIYGINVHMIIAITNLLIAAFSFYKSITNSQAICGNAEVQIIWYTLWRLKLGWILLNRNSIFNIGTLQNSTWIGIFLTLALQINWNGRLSLSYIVCQSSNSLLTKLIFWYRNFCNKVFVHHHFDILVYENRPNF